MKRPARRDALPGIAVLSSLSLSLSLYLPLSLNLPLNLPLPLSLPPLSLRALSCAPYADAERLYWQGGELIELGKTGPSSLDAYAVSTVSPEPCAEGEASQLAGTMLAAMRVNGGASKLSWKARSLPGRVQSDFQTGYVPLEASERALITSKLDTSGFVAPASFDARDLMEGQSRRCAAFDVLDQVATSRAAQFTLHPLRALGVFD